MSGPETVAGLTLAGISIASLFTTCLDCFDIIVKARDFTPDYEILCADLDLQRLRFCIWGETVGLASRSPVDHPIRHPGLDDPAISPVITQALNAIQLLLKQTEDNREQFDTGRKLSGGLRLFRDTYTRLKRSQQSLGHPQLRKVTWWAIHAGDKFQRKIERLKSLIDGLESVTQSLGLLDIQHSRMREEIQSLDNIDDLQLIERVSQHSQPDISDTASRRIQTIHRGSLPHTQSNSITGTGTTDQTFHTAEESLNRVSDIVDTLPEASMVPQHQRILAHSIRLPGEPMFWKAGSKTDAYGSLLKSFDVKKLADAKAYPDPFAYLTTFLAGTVENPSDIFPPSRSTQKRIAAELKNLNHPDSCHWISVAPVKSSLVHILAGIEGPPDTPYENGVFWLDVWMPGDYPWVPMKVNFLTRIYHPNIDSRGKICLDLLDKTWTPALHLLQILVSICSLLSDPGYTDPLVPEIAQIYFDDYQLYCHNARLYTETYASFKPGPEFAS